MTHMLIVSAAPPLMKKIWTLVVRWEAIQIGVSKGQIIMTNQWEAVFNGEKKKLSLVKTTHPGPI
jgi:hypothetical protein